MSGANFHVNVGADKCRDPKNGPKERSGMLWDHIFTHHITHSWSLSLLFTELGPFASQYCSSFVVPQPAKEMIGTISDQCGLFFQHP